MWKLLKQHSRALEHEQEIREDLSFNSKTAFVICMDINLVMKSLLASVSLPESGNKEKQRCVPVPSVHYEKGKQSLFLPLLLHFSNTWFIYIFLFISPFVT